MIRKKKSYLKPKKPFEATRIKEENELIKKYGLKNKREIWKTLAKVNYFRGRAKALAKSPLEEQEVLFKKLRAIGLKISTTSDVLDLKVENLLERRLSTIVAKKGLANTVKHARQLIVHKKIKVDGKVIDSPSYLVPVEKENSIEIKEKKKKPKADGKSQASENRKDSSEAEKENAEIKSDNEQPKEDKE